MKLEISQSTRRQSGCNCARTSSEAHVARYKHRAFAIYTRECKAKERRLVRTVQPLFPPLLPSRFSFGAFPYPRASKAPASTTMFRFYVSPLTTTSCTHAPCTPCFLLPLFVCSSTTPFRQVLRPLFGSSFSQTESIHADVTNGIWR